MGKIKIYEIAKKLNLTSKEVLEMAQKLNIDVKSHMSGVEEEEAKKIEAQLTNNSNEKTKNSTKTTKKEEKSPVIIRREVIIEEENKKQEVKKEEKTNNGVGFVERKQNNNYNIVYRNKPNKPKTVSELFGIKKEEPKAEKIEKVEKVEKAEQGENNQKMQKEAETKNTIVKDVVENVDLIPSNVNLSGAEIELIGVDEKEYILKKIIDKVRRKYDYIIIDCPPSLNMLTINALTAANSVLVPIQCEYYALEGLSQLIHTIDLVKDRLNKKLVMEGVVFTMYDARTNLSLQVVENVKDNLQQNIYKTIIPRNVRLAEAPSYGQPITLYDTKSAGAEAYRLLAEEVINREDE